jgi:hypothetical protein
MDMGIKYHVVMFDAADLAAESDFWAGCSPGRSNVAMDRLQQWLPGLRGPCWAPVLPVLD